MKEGKINMNHFIKVEERRRVNLVMRRTLMADHLPTFEILSDSFITFVKSYPTPYQHTPMSLHNIAAVIQKKKVVSGFILKTSRGQNIAAEFSLTHRWTHLHFWCAASQTLGRDPLDRLDRTKSPAVKTEFSRVKRVHSSSQ